MRIRHTAPSPRRWQLLLSVLCIVLIFLSGTISVAHSHKNLSDDHGSCALCATAHAVAQVSAVPGQIVLVQVYEELVPPTPIFRPRTFIHAHHYTRPPPVSV